MFVLKNPRKVLKNEKKIEGITKIKLQSREN